MTCTVIWLALNFLSAEIDGKQLSNKSKELKQVQGICTPVTLLIHCSTGQVILLHAERQLSNLLLKVIRNSSDQIKVQMRPHAKANSMDFI